MVVRLLQPVVPQTGYTPADRVHNPRPFAQTLEADLVGAAGRPRQILGRPPLEIAFGLNGDDQFRGRLIVSGHQTGRILQQHSVHGRFIVSIHS